MFLPTLYFFCNFRRVDVDYIRRTLSILILLDRKCYTGLDLSRWKRSRNPEIGISLVIPILPWRRNIRFE